MSFFQTTTDTSKRQLKPYGGSSTSRSRTATKDLECKHCCVTKYGIYFYANFENVVPPADSLMCPPKFTVPLRDLSIKDGEALNLTCTVKGDPEPNVTWSKNGEVTMPYIVLMAN